MYPYFIISCIDYNLKSFEEKNYEQMKKTFIKNNIYNKKIKYIITANLKYQFFINKLLKLNKFKILIIFKRVKNSFWFKLHKDLFTMFAECVTSINSYIYRNSTCNKKSIIFE